MSYLARQAQAVIALKARIAAEGHSDDEELVADCIEGQTDFKEVIERLLHHLDEAEMMEAALGIRIKELQQRKLRMGEKAATIRAHIREGMLLADERRMVFPTATLSIRQSPPSVVIMDEDALPDSCVKISRTPDKTAIRTMMESGQEVPGAALSNGGETLTIRKA